MLFMNLCSIVCVALCCPDTAS